MAEENDDELATEQGPELASNDAMPSPQMPSMPSMDGRPMAAPVNPVLAKYLQDKQALQGAQQEVKDNELITGLARAGASLSAGLAHSNKAVDESPYQAMAQADQAPVKNILDAQKAEAADLENQQRLTTAQKQSADQMPNSPASLAKKALIQKLYPGKFSDEDLADLSAADIGDAVMKPLELDQRIQAHKDEMIQRGKDRYAAAENKMDQRSTERQDGAMKNTQALLESARGNPAAAQAERDIYAASKARSLMNLYPDPNHLSQAQVRLLASEVAKIASGGVPTQHELEGIAPETMKGKMSEYVSKLINEPTDANAAEFIKRYKDYTDALTKDAQGFIQDKYGRVIETNKDQLGDKHYQALKTHYLDRFNNQQVPATGKSDLQDAVAQEMARRKSARPQAPVDMSFGAPQTSPSGVPASLNPNYAYGGVVKAPSIPKPPKAPHMPAMPRMPHYAHGGAVGIDDPAKDIATIKATPGEVVLPLSVTQSHDPALAAYLFMKKHVKG